MSFNPIILSIPVYFILITIEWTVNAIQKKNRYNFNDVIGNIGCGITEQVSAIFIKVLVIAAYTFIYTHFRIADVPHTWYWGIILFIAVDFFYYWAHRKSHEINLFWVGHVVHHQSEDYNLSVALRQGTFQKIFTAAFFWPLAILGFDPVWFLLMGAFVTLYQFWIHTEYINKMGWFEYIFNTPSHHRVHHGRDAKYLDKNHGGTFIIWDRIFGTFQEEAETPNYGVTSQLQTFNPVSATLIPVKQIIQKTINAPGISNKFKSLFYGPGWTYAPQSEKEIVHKYRVPLSTKMIAYLGFMFLQTIAFSSYVLFSYKTMPSNMVIILASVSIFSLWSIGNLADNKKYAVWIEVFRVVLIGVLFVLEYA
jgi:sterol desaturase/sphingolipid hydroxylase (fatty acid hydroxylase superfamily)